MKTQQLRPRVLVSYVREPYVYAAGNVRVTFDSNIRTSLFQREFLNGTLPDIIATDAPGDIILEVKYDAFLPEIIRPKGNTSLTSIANDPTTDRYSFKLEFDHYVDGQTCFGLDKLILNNNYADATNMKEALIYDMYQYLGADASLYNYAKLSVNGEYWGVYLALEAVEDSFLLRNYGVQDGELYKPDSMNIGGGKDFGDFNADDIDFGDLDLDNLLRYMAVHIFSVNEDSLSGSMAHNYYLYEAGGKLNLIPWDYNLALGGMGRSNDATSVVNDAIDNAFSGTNFFDTLMADETCHSRYYAYLQQLVNEYIGGGGFDAPAASETRTAPDMSDGSEHAPPAGFGPSQFSGEVQNADDPQQTAEDAPASGDAASGGRPDPGSFPGSSADASAAIPTDSLLLYALSLLPLTAALLFALLYRRRPRKQ